MAQLVRTLIDGYHDIMDNKSGGLTLWRYNCTFVVPKGRIDQLQTSSALNMEAAGFSETS